MKWRASIAIGALSFAIAVSASESSFAQAGSTGGTLGKTDKSLSGEREDQTRPQPTPRTTTRTKPIGPKTFQNPTIRGVGVDWCMTSTASGCGETAATTWCRSQGLTHATSFKWAVASPVYRQGDRDICSGFCGGFTEIICE